MADHFGVPGQFDYDRPIGQSDRLVHHSDRGVQYLSIRYTERLAEAGIELSVGSTGDSYVPPPWQGTLDSRSSFVLLRRALQHDSRDTDLSTSDMFVTCTSGWSMPCPSPAQRRS
jgi:hypothetical protein